MKKWLGISGLLLIMLVAGFILTGTFSSGVAAYTSKISGITINVPKQSIFVEECCMYALNFKSLKSPKLLREEFEKDLLNYELLSCDDRIYYYDPGQDFTIYEYNFYARFIFNEFTIIYDKGNACSIPKD